MNKRKIASRINELKLEMMDRDSMLTDMIADMLTKIAITNKNIYVKFQELENDMRDDK